MNEIKTTGFVVQFYGDKSVGIFDQKWTIDGEFYFESQEDLSAFKEKIAEAFEHCSDTPIGVMTTEEYLSSLI